MKRGVWNRLLGLAMRQGAVEIGFGAARDDHVGLAHGHGAHGEKDGIEAGGALAVDGQRRHAFAQAGRQPDQAGRVAARRGVAEDDLLDGAGIELRVLQGGEHDRGGEVFQPPAAMQAARPAERRTARRNQIR